MDSSIGKSALKQLLQLKWHKSVRHSSRPSLKLDIHFLKGTFLNLCVAKRKNFLRAQLPSLHAHADNISRFFAIGVFTLRLMGNH